MKSNVRIQFEVRFQILTIIVHTWRTLTARQSCVKTLRTTTKIQGQMGILNVEYCDIFIFTQFGYVLDRVQFDSEFWSTLKCRLMWFWNSFVAPKLLSGQFRKLPGIPEVESCGLDHAYASSHDKKSSTKSTSSSKFKLGTGIYNVSDVCYLCSEPCKDNFIQCNTCFMSYHKSCVGSDIAFSCYFC